MPRLNNALRAYANLDVTKGQMSLDSSLQLDGRVLRGRMEPRISDLEVYDEKQDADENVVQQAYEAVVGAVAGVLKGGDDTAEVDTAFDVAPTPVATWGAALYAMRDAWRHKLRTVLHVVSSDPDEGG